MPPEFQFESPLPVGREEAILALAADDSTGLPRIMVAVTLNDPDGEWIEQFCWRAAEHPDVAVRSLAGLCLGHVARRFGTVRPESWLVVRRLGDDRSTDGRPLDGLDDMRQFAGPEPAM